MLVSLQRTTSSRPVSSASMPSTVSSTVSAPIASGSNPEQHISLLGDGNTFSDTPDLSEPPLFANPAFDDEIPSTEREHVQEMSAKLQLEDSDSDDEQPSIQTSLNQRSSRIQRPPQFHHSANIASVEQDAATFDSKYGAFQLMFSHTAVLAYTRDVSNDMGTYALAHSALLALDPTSLSAAALAINPDAHSWAAAFQSTIYHR